MDFLKKLFNEGAIDWETFSKGCTDAGFKIADLATGNYVSKGKYDDDLAAKDSQLEELNRQLTTRDTDLADLKSRLETSGADNKSKVADLTAQLENLQTTYDNSKQEYESKIAKQAYEFAVNTYANEKNFTSSAAKRDFVREMLAENLKMKDNVILGADDFVKAYSEANSDAFVVDTPPDVEPPIIIKPTEPKPVDENVFSNMFSFTGVRPHNK